MLFLVQLLFNPLALLGSEPGGFAWPIRQNEERNGAQQDGRHSFQDEQPAPAFDGEPPVAENPARDW